MPPYKQKSYHGVHDEQQKLNQQIKELKKKQALLVSPEYQKKQLSLVENQHHARQIKEDIRRDIRLIDEQISGLNQQLKVLLRSAGLKAPTGIKKSRLSRTLAAPGPPDEHPQFFGAKKKRSTKQRKSTKKRRSTKRRKSTLRRKSSKKKLSRRR